MHRSLEFSVPSLGDDQFYCRLYSHMLLLVTLCTFLYFCLLRSRYHFTLNFPMSRIRPSWVAEPMRVPSWVNMLARTKPREPADSEVAPIL